MEFKFVKNHVNILLERGLLNNSVKVTIDFEDHIEFEGLIWELWQTVGKETTIYYDQDVIKFKCNSFKVADDIIIFEGTEYNG